MLRRKYFRLCCFHAIAHGLGPAYLNSLCPDSIGTRKPYGLRNSSNLQTIPYRKTFFRRSFIPSPTSDWNNSKIETRNLDSLKLFKSHLKREMFSKQHNFINTGHGHGTVNHSRIRMGLSGLNAHCKKYGFITNSQCNFCQHNTENEIHFFLDCPHHAGPRHEMLMSLTNLLAYERHNIPLQPHSISDKNTFIAFLLWGSDELAVNLNKTVMNTVRRFITASKRFF